MAKRWKVGVIGCGSMSQYVHMPGYLDTPGVDLVAACDPGRKQRLAAKRICPDVHTYDDYRKMLAAEELDVISVVSPNRFHAEHAVAALEHGAHVLLEKPAALSMQEIAQIKKNVRRSKQQLIVGFSHRFARVNQRIRRMLADGTIGEPYMLRYRLAHSGPYPGWAQ